MFAAPAVQVLALLSGIHGTVHAAGAVGSVAGVRVEVDGSVMSATDSAGSFLVTGLDSGSHHLRFVSVRYEPRDLTVLLASSAVLTLDVELVPRPIFLAPISVVAGVAGDSAAPDVAGAPGGSEAGLYRYGSGWQTAQVAGNDDINGVLARVPGVSTRGDNVTALSVHGGSGSENLVLLDGIPLYGAVHFAGAGSAVNPDAIAAMDVHTGVSSARYGGALAGVIELETLDDATANSLTGNLSPSDLRSMARAPLGRNAGVMLSARSSFRDLMTDAPGARTMNGYDDLLATGHVDLGDGILRVLGFESSNRLHWEPTLSDAAGADAGRPQAPFRSSDAANWQSQALGATWARATAATTWHLAGWWSGTSASISTLASAGAAQVHSALDQLGVTADWSDRLRAGTATLGAELTRPRSWYTAAIPMTPGTAGSSVALEAAPAVGAIYGEWYWQALSHVDARVGLRASTALGASAWFDPRLVVNLRPDPSTRVEFGYGRTHQLTQSMLNDNNIMTTVVGPALLLTAPGSVRPAAADQWIAGVARRLAPGVTVSLDGYIRSWQHVLTPAVATTGLFVAGTPLFGDGRARGLTASLALVRQRLTVDMTGGLASSTQQANGVAYPSAYVRPWSVAGTLHYRLPAQITLDAGWNTGAGEPSTAVLPDIEWRPYQAATGIGEIEGAASTLGGSINALRLSAPVRVDLGVRRQWHVGVLGRAGTITTALGLQNLLDRADPVAVMTMPDGTLQLLRGTPRGVVFEVGWVH